jgi:predicted nucleic acid-binding protein
MIILDTNVLSEVMRAQPAARVLAWLGAQDMAELYTTTISRAESLAGIAILPDGRRRDAMETVATRIFDEDFQDRVLAFDLDASTHYAAVVAIRRRIGRPTKPLDAMIAAIARSRNAAIATRNIADFEGCGVHLHDPWQA